MALGSSKTSHRFLSSHSYFVVSKLASTISLKSNPVLLLHNPSLRSPAAHKDPAEQLTQCHPWSLQHREEGEAKKTGAKASKLSSPLTLATSMGISLNLGKMSNEPVSNSWHVIHHLVIITNISSPFFLVGFQCATISWQEVRAQ